MNPTRRRCPTASACADLAWPSHGSPPTSDNLPRSGRPATAQQEETAMTDAPTFGRYAELPVDRMTPEQRAGYSFLVDGPRGRLPGPYKVWVHNPKLLHAAAPMFAHFTPGQS